MGEEKVKKEKKEKKDKKEKKEKKEKSRVEEAAVEQAPVAPAPVAEAVAPVPLAVKAKKEKKDKTGKADKKDKKDKKEKKAVPAAAPAPAPDPVLVAAPVVQEAVATKEKKDNIDKKGKKEKAGKKDKKDKKEKKEKRPGGEGAQPDAKRQKVAQEDVEMSKFWEETLGDIDERSMLSAAETQEAERARQAEREEAEREAQARARALAEEEAAADAAAEAERALRAAEAAEAAAANLGPPTQAAADAIMAEETALETDATRSRSLMLREEAVRHLRAEGERWLHRARQLSPHATIVLYQFDNGSWEAQIDGTRPGAARRAELCLRCLLAAHAGEAVELRVLPESDGELVETLEVPEAAAGMVQPQKLAESWEAVAAFVREKDVVQPRPQTTPEKIELGKVLGLAIGQPVEVRFETTWYHADVIDFPPEGDVEVRWLGGTEADTCRCPAVDVRASNRDPKLKVAKAAPTFGRLVLFGELRPRTGARLQAMAAVDRKVIGHFAERHPPEPSGDAFGFDVKVLELPPEDGGACARYRSKVAKASEALVEVLGRHAVVAGEADERRRAETLLTRVVPQAGAGGECAEVPEELQDHSQVLRVPRELASVVAGADRAALSRIEDDAGCIALWLPTGTRAPLRPGAADRGGVCASGYCIGSAVQARCSGGEWRSATVRGDGEVEGTVCVEWDSDGGEQDVKEEDVKDVDADGAASKRDVMLRRPRILTLIGPERARMAGALQVMALAESACSSLWTGSLEEACAEARDGRADEDAPPFDVEAHVHDGTAAELEWLKGPVGQQALRGVERAAPCVVQLVGRAVFFGGYCDQRQRAQEYLRWALQSRASAAGKPALSVADADMREDVSISTMQEAQAVWLRQERLWSIEKETETLLVFDDGGGTALGPGLRRLLVCGCSESQRRRAAAAAASVGAPNSGGLAAAPAAAQTALGAAAPAAASAASAAETSTTASQRTQPERSNPKEILKTIPWPATVNQWGLLQKKIWIGWPRLPQGWIRCWSRSQDSAYFLRLKDMKTTFEFSEVR